MKYQNDPKENFDYIPDTPEELEEWRRSRSQYDDVFEEIADKIKEE